MTLDEQESLSLRLEQCYSGVLHDVMRTRGMSSFTLPPELRPILPERPMAGPAFTISGRPCPGVEPHETLVAWTGLLSKAKSGHIWISQPNDHTVAHMGELSGETLLLKGLRGVVTDGFIRDTDFLMKMGFQVWGRGFTPRDIVGYWMPFEVDTPICIGEVEIHPGDFIMGDRDGCLVIPEKDCEEITKQAEESIATENLIRKAILNGVDPQEAYLKYGMF
ncbi:MAG: RraA family protein [SAR324 cluster bacterium]|nr:RraA family protein [SAR324 cluster bacterium]